MIGYMVGGAGLVALWVAAVGSDTFRSCVVKASAGDSAKSNEFPKDSFMILRDLGVYTRCSVSFLYEYRDAATVLATVIIAMFTKALFRATDDIRKGGDATAKVMVAQKAAMEATATAMEVMALAMESSADMATRDHIAAYPPELHFVSAYIEPGTDGAAPVIVFRLGNKGRSPALIVASWVHDSAFRRSVPSTLGTFESVTNQEDLVDYRIARNQQIEARHICANISNGDIPALPTLESMFRPIGHQSEPAPPPETVFSFGGTIAFTDEAGNREPFSFTANCTPPARYFAESNPLHH